MGKLFRIEAKEEKLLRLLKKGDSSAQKTLYEMYASEMLGVCVRYLKSKEDAEEVFSNAFIKVFSRIDQYKGEGVLVGWIRRIMVNESLNFIKARKEPFAEMEEENSLAISHQDVESKIEVEYLMSLVENLPTGYRTVFNLYAIEGYGHKEIGEMLGISEGSSKSQLSKARRKLQDRIGETNLLYQQL